MAQPRSVVGLSFVRVPSPEEERFRDLARCREAIRADLMRARHRVSKFLLRRELRWEGSACAWTQAHWKWLDEIEFPDGPPRRCSPGCPGSPWAETIARLRCLRGINSLTALGLCAEAGDPRRFKHPSSLMAYFGIVPSEHSSGEQHVAAGRPALRPRAADLDRPRPLQDCRPRDESAVMG